MTTAYFTFGQDHVHSVGGFTYDKDVVVKITADDPQAVMFDTFGQKWSMQYDEDDVNHMTFMCHFPRGIKELGHASLS